MTTDDCVEAVLDSVTRNSDDLSLSEYIDALDEIIEELKIRKRAAQDDLEQE